MGGGGGRGCEGEDMTRRPAAILIAFEGQSERGGGGQESRGGACPCTNCTHMHVVFPPISLSHIAILLQTPFSI